MSQSPKFKTIKDIQDSIEKMLAESRNRSVDRDNAQIDRAKRAYDAGKAEWQSIRGSKKRNFNDLLRACGMPKMFAGLQAYEQDRQSYFLTGACGTGKTFKAALIFAGHCMAIPCTSFNLDTLDAVAKCSNIFPRFITAPELLMKIRSCFSLNECEESIVQRYASCPLLVLDDLGIEKTTDFALQTLYIILNSRYSNQLQTIITSNLTLQEVSEKLGDRIASRIAGMCKVAKMSGNDRRLSKS